MANNSGYVKQKNCVPDTAGEIVKHDFTGGAAHVTDQGINGGGRNEATQTNNFTATKHECNSTILNTTTTSQAVSGGAPAYLMGITIHTALAGTLTITGLTNVAGVATNWVIPIGAVGEVLPAGNARRCETALSATLSSATDYDRVMIDWRPIS